MAYTGSKAQTGASTVLAMTTSTSFVLTQATYSSGSVTYTGTITAGDTNAFAGYVFTVSGFSTSGNNGTFMCTASTSSTLVCTNAGGANETSAGTALQSTVVGEVKSIKLSGRKWDTDDVTNMQSGMKEFVNAIADPGEWSLGFSRVSADNGQVLLESCFGSGAITPFLIILKKSSSQNTIGDIYSFKALVTEVNYSFEPTKADAGDAKLKISGVITPTAGY